MNTILAARIGAPAMKNRPPLTLVHKSTHESLTSSHLPSHRNKLVLLFLQKWRYVMNNLAPTSRTRPAAAAVLSKAVKNAAERLNVSQAALGKIIGLSPATISRMHAGQFVLEEQSKQWDLALLFVRVFRSLDSIVGDDESARKWLNGENLGLNGRPIALIQQTEGLVRVVHYLDASRGII
jgi:uncharacterized protein (DUF2384 family)